MASNVFSQQPGETPGDLADRYYHIIPAPVSADEWDGWRAELVAWKDSLLGSIRYDDTYYTKPEYEWASRTYSTLFLVASDQALYNERWNYEIEKYLSKYETGYGGVDIVLLWPTYPQLGFDNRDQYEFYRNMPGGIAGLRKLSDEIHRMGKKLFIAYNPWDEIARNNGKVDEEELIKLVVEINADGIFLDTISSVEGFRDKLNEARPGVVFQSELGTTPAQLAEIHQSWLEVAWSAEHKNLEFEEVPFVMRNRWLEQRHQIFRLSRWSHEQSAVIQNAWMNGCGVVIWENVFGTVNKLNARDRSMLSSMLPVQRRYSRFFTHGKWTPLVPTGLNRVYASLWKFQGGRLWTIVNRQEQMAMGRLMQVDHTAGTLYFDLVEGKEVKADVHEGKASFQVRYGPRAIGCILAVDKAEVSDDFLDFLAHQARTFNAASGDYSYHLPEHTLREVTPTAGYSPDKIPSGMVAIPVPGDSISMEFKFRKREPGFYPMKGVPDHSYVSDLHEMGRGEVTVKLTPYAMDETPVTNRQFARFLKDSGYKPDVGENFLKHWKNGRPPKGEEDHPVTWVTLDDARAYARWAGKRLATEAEWQWAAQNGERKDPYPWGQTFDATRANGGQTGGTTGVKKFKSGRTMTGLYDISGNVWELTESERTDGSNRYCIVRGGSWYVTRGSGWYADQGPQETSMGAKYLFIWPGLDRCATVGFRCVVDLRH